MKTLTVRTVLMSRSILTMTRKIASDVYKKNYFLACSNECKLKAIHLQMLIGSGIVRSYKKIFKGFGLTQSQDITMNIKSRGFIQFDNLISNISNKIKRFTKM